MAFTWFLPEPIHYGKEGRHFCGLELYIAQHAKNNPTFAFIFIKNYLSLLHIFASVLPASVQRGTLNIVTVCFNSNVWSMKSIIRYLFANDHSIYKYGYEYSSLQLASLLEINAIDDLVCGVMCDCDSIFPSIRCTVVASCSLIQTRESLLVECSTCLKVAARS